MAIAPSSTILYELCSVKMPILSGYYVDNQELIYKGFFDNNAIYKGGDMKNYEINDFKTHVKTLLSDHKFSHQIEAQKTVSFVDLLFVKKVTIVILLRYFSSYKPHILP